MKRRTVSMQLACLFAALTLLVLCTAVTQAENVFLVTYDIGAQASGPAPDPYPGAVDDILAGSTNALVASDGKIYMVDSTGPQGGQALYQGRGAAWPHKEGYTFSGLPTTAPSTGVGPDYFVASSYTIECLIKPDYTDTGMGLSTASTIFNSLGDATNRGYVTLALNQTTGELNFTPSNIGGGTYGAITSSIALEEGEWYHVGVVVRGTGDSETQQTELWINGELNGTGTYPIGWETDQNYRIPGTFNLGGSLAVNQQSWQGETDAFAISDTALNSSSFVLPVPEPFTVSLLLAGGSLVVLRRRK